MIEQMLREKLKFISEQAGIPTSSAMIAMIAALRHLSTEFGLNWLQIEAEAQNWWAWDRSIFSRRAEIPPENWEKYNSSDLIEH
jgi:hypothetical protein